MKISKTKFKNNNANYSILIGLGAIKNLKKQIALVCPDSKKVALIFDKKIPDRLKNKVKQQVKNYKVCVYQYSVSEKLKSFKKVNQLNESLLISLNSDIYLNEKYKIPYISLSKSPNAFFSKVKNF